MSINYNFKVGDVIIDTLTKEIGLLVERYDVFAEYLSYYANDDIDDVPPIWAWEILWAGSKTELTKKGRKGAYTELGLGTLISQGEFELLSDYEPKGSKSEP